MPSKHRGHRQQRILELLADGKPRWQGDIADQLGYHGYAAVHNALKLLETDGLVVGKLEHRDQPSSKTNRKLWTLNALS